MTPCPLEEGEASDDVGGIIRVYDNPNIELFRDLGKGNTADKTDNLDKVTSIHPLPSMSPRLVELSTSTREKVRQCEQNTGAQPPLEDMEVAQTNH